MGAEGRVVRRTTRRSARCDLGKGWWWGDKTLTMSTSDTRDLVDNEMPAGRGGGRGEGGEGGEADDTPFSEM